MKTCLKTLISRKGEQDAKNESTHILKKLLRDGLIKLNVHSVASISHPSSSKMWIECSTDFENDEITV